MSFTEYIKSSPTKLTLFCGSVLLIVTFMLAPFLFLVVGKKGIIAFAFLFMGILYHAVLVPLIMFAAYKSKKIQFGKYGKILYVAGCVLFSLFILPAVVCYPYFYYFYLVLTQLSSTTTIS